MQHYFLDYQELQIGDLVDFNQDQSHHLQRVLRMKTGDQVIGVSKNRDTFILELIIHDEIQATVIEKTEGYNELPVQVDIVCGLPKGSKLDHIVQKASELGVFQIYPWQAARSIVKWEGKKSNKKVTRLQKIATEASEQSHRNHEVHVRDSVNTQELLTLFEHYDHVLIAYEESAKEGETSRLAHVFQHLEKNARLLMVFGPEGGIAEQEIEQFQSFKNVELVGLGKRILRTETAPLFALSALVYEMELR